LGKYIPNIDKVILPIILIAIAVPLLSSFYETVKTKERRARLRTALTRKKKD
jgi:hypothetical protein